MEGAVRSAALACGESDDVDINKLLRIDWFKHVTRFNDVIIEAGLTQVHRDKTVAQGGERQA